MRIVTLRRWLPLAALPVLVVAPACDGGGESAASRTSTAVALASASPTVAPPSPTPTPAPADPELGDRLRYEGDIEGAIGVYQSIADQAEGEEALDARLAQAQLLVRESRFAEARVALDAYLRDAGPDADATPARYMLASVLDDLGDTAGSLANYDAYIAAGGMLADFAQIERSKLLARLGRGPEAEAAAQAVLASDLLPDFKSSFLLSMARAFEQGGDDARALAWYDRVLASGANAPAALSSRGAIKQRLGDPSWVDDYTAAIARYPASAEAPAMIEALDAAAAPVSPYARGVVLYRSFQNDAARASLTAAAEQGDNVASARYYLGALDERAGDHAAAIEQYRRAYETDPASPLAADALWWRGRLLENAGDYDDAGAVYATLQDGYPASEWAEDAGFRRGLVRWKAGDYAGAAAQWAAHAQSITGPRELRARFWQARALLAMDDPLAEPVLRQLIERAPHDWYALRAEILLDENEDSEDAPRFEADAPDWDAIAAYLRDAVSIDPLAADEPAPDPRLATARALADVELRAQSDAVARAVLDDSRNDIAALYWLARRWSDEGETSLAARAATTLVERLRERRAPAPPEDLLRVAYPPAYIDVAEPFIDDAGIDPLLMLALVRQESFYDADAGSVAGALGLTQVIPSTGEGIAAELGVEFRPQLLFRPNVSLRFGASYLGSQLDAFGRNAYHALAAYNGGPGTARQALGRAGDDIDLFVEELEFSETRAYVLLVMEHYAQYRHLYAGVERPSLPD